MKLCNIDFNRKVIIDKVNLHGIKKRRIYDLGFIPGEIVTKKYESIFKDPNCYKIKNTLIAIRNEDAYNIEVKYE